MLGNFDLGGRFGGQRFCFSLLFQRFSKPVEGLSGLSERGLGLVGLLFQFISEPLDVIPTLVGDGAGIAPGAFAKDARTEVYQRNAFVNSGVTVRKTDARPDREVCRDACPLAVAKKGFQNRVGDGMLCEHGVHLFDTEVYFIQAFAEHLDFLREALKLGPVNHVRRPSQLLGVEEAPAEVFSNGKRKK